MFRRDVHGNPRVVTCWDLSPSRSRKFTTVGAQRGAKLYVVDGDLSIGTSFRYRLPVPTTWWLVLVGTNIGTNLRLRRHGRCWLVGGSRDGFDSRPSVGCSRRRRGNCIGRRRDRRSDGSEWLDVYSPGASTIQFSIPRGWARWGSWRWAW